MLGRLLFSRRSAKNRIPGELWETTLASLTVFDHLDAPAREKLKRLAEAFLEEKRFFGAHGLPLTDAMLVRVAAQAALLVLELGMSAYRGWVGVVLYPEEFVIPKRELDEAGVMHEFDEIAAGEAWDDGPVLLSWRDAEAAAPGYNVVLHEFAHKLDLLNGEADGIPRLHSGLAMDEWQATLDAAYADFCQRLRRAESHRSPAAVEHALSVLPLDDYAAEDPSEFFAVASESFFSDPETLHAAYPAFYRLLARYYRQEPRLQKRMPGEKNPASWDAGL